MRLGEIKQIIDKVIDENNAIVIEHMIVYGGQAYQISNFFELVEAFDLIKDFQWNDVDSTGIAPIIEKYRVESVVNPVQIDQAEYAVLSAYFAAVNKKMPFYYSILDTMCEEQGERIINIKLPAKITSLEELNEVNTRLRKMLIQFNFGKEFTFVGFDTGSSWYMMDTSQLTWAFFVSCLKIAQDILNFTTGFFRSQEARFSYQAAKLSLEVAKKKTDRELNQKVFQDNYIKGYLEHKVKEVIEEIGSTNGWKVVEAQTKLVLATKSLVEELGEGTEFHLSLNPPDYARETNMGLEIEYKKIKQLLVEEEKTMGEHDAKKIESSVKIANETTESPQTTEK